MFIQVFPFTRNKDLENMRKTAINLKREIPVTKESRNQESEVRRQESEARSQKSGALDFGRHEFDGETH